MNVNFDQEILIALGGNIPLGRSDPASTLTSAVKTLAESGLVIRRLSRFFRTPCFPPGAGPDYVNAAAVLRGERNPAEVLAALHAVEDRFGRERAQRWGMRTLDLDLLGMGDIVLPDMAGFRAWADLPPDAQGTRTPDRLILPHPRLQERAFVLVPLADVAARWRHPVTGLSVARMLAALPADARAEITPL